MALENSTYADFDAINAANKAANTDNRFKSGSKDTVAESQDTFLKLLTTQLQNQDPLNPMDNAQMTSQLAQISTVDGITKLNATLQSMMSSVSDSQTLQSAALVNRVVLVPGKGLRLHEEKSAGGLELAGPADRVTVNIADANGLPVATLELGDQKAGVVNFVWDGKASDGSAAADGYYNIRVEALRGGEKVEVKSLEYAAVNSVARSGKGITLDVGNLGAMTLDDVRQII